MMNFRNLSMLLGATFAVAVGTGATPASAQATRTWVSGVGDDANPCSRTAPCKTFAGAISKTATGGEINCLDPGGFGGVTITKALSIVCDYTEGGILSAGAGVNGIVVNAPATSIVFLSGLDFSGAGTAQNGVRFIAGAALHIRNSIIRNYRATNGLGVSFQPSGTSSLTIVNSTIADNGTGATGGGILIQPTGAGGNARVMLNGVRVLGNANNAMRVDATGNTGPSTLVTIHNSDFTGSANGLSVIAPAGPTLLGVMVVDSVLAHNSGNGITANGPNALVQVGNSTIYSNSTGVLVAGGATINTFGDNRVFLNAVNGTFSGLPIPKL